MQWIRDNWGKAAAIGGAIVLVSSVVTASEKLVMAQPLATKNYVVIVVDSKMAPLLGALQEYGLAAKQNELSVLRLQISIMMSTKISLEDSLQQTGGTNTTLRLEIQQLDTDIEKANRRIQDLECEISGSPRC